MIGKAKTFLYAAAIYISLAGLVTFSQFILEEAFQTAMFGTWPAKNAKQWDQVKRGVDIMRATNMTLKIVTYSCGWIQPLAFFSYLSYAKSADYYINSLTTECIANAPELFIGQYVEFEFTPNNFEYDESGVLAKNGNLAIYRKNQPEPGRIKVSGILERREQYLFVNELK